MNYPKTIQLENEKLKKLLTEKEELILQGREKSMEIDALQGEMDEIDQKLKDEEKKIDITDLKAKAEELTLEYNAVMRRMGKANEEARKRLFESTPQGLRDDFKTKKEQKEKLEVERNKIALKAQQKSDKIIPLGRNLMKHYLEDEFDDYDTLRIENGKAVGTIFNHIEDFKASFRKRAKK